ncbi:MAG: hypothetical protein P8076_12145 [Gammaproteobacteria bacterium]
MGTLEDYPIDELRRIYRLLHSQLPQQPELMDSEFLHDLQTLLQQRAAADGVDVSLHAQWASWLNDGRPLTGL